MKANIMANKMLELSTDSGEAAKWIKNLQGKDGVFIVAGCAVTGEQHNPISATMHLQWVETKESKPLTFRQELESLINKHSKENESNTPDFALAGFLEACLAAFNASVLIRDHYNKPKPVTAYSGKQSIADHVAKVAGNLVPERYFEPEHELRQQQDNLRSYGELVKDITGVDPNTLQFTGQADGNLSPDARQQIDAFLDSKLSPEQKEALGYGRDTSKDHLTMETLLTKQAKKKEVNPHWTDVAKAREWKEEQ